MIGLSRKSGLFRRIAALLCAAMLFAGTVVFSSAAEKPDESMENAFTGTVSNNDVMDKNQQFLTLSATDALGRSTDPVGGMKSDRYVGIFYFIWFGGSNPGALDTTKLLMTNPEELFDPRDTTGIAPPGAMYYFNQPLYGYYSSTDRWVVRKHIELFTQAGLDFIAIDLSNDVIYEPALTTLLSVLQEYSDAGWKVPKVMAYTNLNSGHTAQMLYDFMYREGKYKDLWFYGPYDKPILVANRGEIESEEILDFFYIRPAQWPAYEYGYLKNGWPFCDLNRPQRTHKNLIGVSVAQHNSYIFSYGLRTDSLYPMSRINYGRGYTSGNPVNGNVDAILAGANIQEEWDYAISEDPEIIFVTGWNEWATNKRLPEHEDQTVAWFVDSFNTEFSRDIEMTASPTYVYDEATGKYTAEGYGDNYYCQMVDNIRRYKGTAADADRPCVTVRVDMNAYREEDWRNTCTFVNMSPDNTPRVDYNYRMAAAVNFIRELHVTNDEDNVYFLITTDTDAVLDPEKTNLLNLLVGVPGKTGFEGYAYLINRYYGGNGTTSVEYTESGYDGFRKAADAKITVKGRQVMIAVPRSVFGVEGKEDFTLTVKATDSVRSPENMLDYYVSGEVLPLGRFGFTYSGAGVYTAYAEDTDRGTDTAPESAAETGIVKKESSSAVLPLCIGGAVLAAATAALITVKKRKKA